MSAIKKLIESTRAGTFGGVSVADAAEAELRERDRADAEMRVELMNLRTRVTNHQRADSELLAAYGIEWVKDSPLPFELRMALERWAAAKGGGK